MNTNHIFIKSFIVPLFKAVLHQLSDKNKAVCEAAEITRAAMVKLASQHITAKIMNTLSLMIPQEKW